MAKISLPRQSTDVPRVLNAAAKLVGALAGLVTALHMAGLL
jgi:hypothetical protein